MGSSSPMDYFLNTEVIVHAGGLSERWFPVTQGKIPKPLTEIGKKSRPIMDWIILPYAMSGMKKIFISLWHNPEPLKEYLNKLSKNSGIEFVFLEEPKDKRLGRAGVIRYFMEKGILSKDKPKLSLNASDIIKINPLELAKYQMHGIERGFLASLVVSSTEVSQFGKLKADPKTNQVKFFEEKPINQLASGDHVNTGMLYIDGELNKLFFDIEDYPVDWERSKILPQLLKVTRVFNYAIPFKNWLFFHTPQDHRKAADMDFEKFFEITNVERYLGPYSPESL